MAATWADDIFKCNFVNENVSVSIKIPLNFVPKAPIDNNLSLVQVMAWRRTGDKLLHEQMHLASMSYVSSERVILEWCTALFLLFLMYYSR